MRRGLVYGTSITVLIVGVLAGALTGTGWASTKSVRLHADAVRVPLSVACPSATSSPGCRITLQLWTTAGGRFRAGMLVGSATALVAPGRRRRITVSLTHLGRHLLRERSPLPLTATTVTTTAPASSSSTAPTSATTPPSTLPSCPPTQNPIGPGPDAAVGGTYSASAPLDCAG